MQRYMISSAFGALPIEVFWYPAEKPTSHTALLLKGLYGFHDPESTGSWDMEVIRACRQKYNIVCINSARREVTIDERKTREAFVGKTFRQECDDIYRAYTHLEKEGLIGGQTTLHVIGNSFGGTILLGVSELLLRASSIVMIGSGCGKSATTTKPLLETLLDEETLLSPLKAYTGVFTFIRGSEDSVVPAMSQDKIITSAQNASVRTTSRIRGANHDLSPASSFVGVNRTNIIVSAFEWGVALSREVS